MVGLGDGAGKLPVPGRPATFAYSRARACSRCGTDRLYFLFFFHLSSLSNVLSFGRRLNMTELMWFGGQTPTVVVSSCRGRPRLVLVNRLILVNRLEGLKSAQEQCNY